MADNPLTPALLCGASICHRGIPQRTLDQVRLQRHGDKLVASACRLLMFASEQSKLCMDA
jgi:hypothetical protein